MPDPSKAAVLREQCCYMVLHGGHPDPEKVVNALSEVEAKLALAVEALRATTTALDEITDTEWDGDLDWKAIATAVHNARAALKGGDA